MSRRLVVCLDGTGNEIGSNLSNVLKFYRLLVKSEEQRVYYDPGVGTIGKPSWWHQMKQKVRGVLGLALGLGLDDNVLDAYSWLCRNYEAGDEIWLFGFSRGAYTARVLAGFIHMCGLLRPDQLNLCGYALVAYKRSADTGDMEIGKTFRRVAQARRPTIRFMGVWDTVASVIVPRADRFYLPSRQTLPFTRENPSVRAFRHAISIDERRRMFRLNHWQDPQDFRADPDAKDQLVPQDIKQVWFAGAHSDVGGGYPEKESGLSKYPLLWMIEEARCAGQGLRFDDRLVGWLGEGRPPQDRLKSHEYVAPDPKGMIHKSLSGFWWLLEPIPQRTSEREWPGRTGFLGLYIPWAEPRPIPNRPWKGKPPTEPFAIHRSVVERIMAKPHYRPVNLPETFALEPPGPLPPGLPAPPYRPEGALARTWRLLTRFGGAGGWAQAAKTALWLLPLIGLLGWWGGFAMWDPRFDRELLIVAAVALLLPALAEETVFRGIVLKPPPDTASALGPALLSAILFALWHPLQALLWDPQWEPIAWSWPFLLAVSALGFACARLVQRSGSLWPAVALHWIVVVLWKALFGGPGLPLPL